MTRKNSNIKFLTNIINSPKSTPEKIKNAFFKYIKHTRKFYGRQLNRNDISSEDYSDNIELLDALKDRINLMFIKIQRLEGRNRRLETKEINLQAEINSLKKENKDLIKENETLKKENEAIKHAVSHLDEIYRNNEVQYE
ncbi:10576_t:CDS:1, partial [Racocetra fulgida]